jgi:hypothetical protein
LIQAAYFQVGGSYLVLHFPVSVFVPLGIPQVGSTLFGSVFRFRLPFSGFIKAQHHINSSVTYAITADIEELSAGTISEGALAYLIEYVLPKDQGIILSFFEYNGIEDFEDFMSFDFNQTYSTLDKPDTL